MSLSFFIILLLPLTGLLAYYLYLGLKGLYGKNKDKPLSDYGFREETEQRGHEKQQQE